MPRRSRAMSSEPSAGSEPQSPRRFYEMLLVYPTLGLALITAVPTWWDKYQAWRLDIQRVTAAKAMRQAELFQKNMSCMGAPFSYYSSPRQVEIDATICDSGDILVSTVVPKQDPYISIVALDDLVHKSGDNGLIPSANAATLPPRYSQPTVAKAPLRLAQVTATVLCQRMVENRYIHRRIQTPQGCRDQIIDTYNGRITSDRPAPCVPQC